MMKRGKTIWQLSEHTCRWPQGEPDEPAVFFCGATPHPGQPYCFDHCCRAFLYFRRERQRAA